MKEVSCFRINRAIEYAHEKLGMKWDSNRQRLDFYGKVGEHLCLEKPKDVLLLVETLTESLKNIREIIESKHFKDVSIQDVEKIWLITNNAISRS